MAAEALEPNRILAGRYRLEVRLGQGGMGSIWRAEHLVLQAPVAVKLIDRDAVPDEDTLSRFMREAKAAASLRSPHVVQIIDYGVEGPVPFMVSFAGSFIALHAMEAAFLRRVFAEMQRSSPSE